MDFVIIFVLIIYTLLFLLVIIKSVLFFKSTSYPSLGRYIYFNAESIYNSANPQKEKAKILQNKFSIAILITTLFAVTVTLIILK